jgi:Protein of unknown function (DUF2924)
MAFATTRLLRPNSVRVTRKDVEDEIARLRGLDLAGLVTAWRAVFGRPAPAHLPKYLVLRILAYRLQAEAFGDLSRALARTLDDLGRADKDAAPLAAPSGQSGPRPGTVLVREHNGERHHVMVVQEGYSWKGKTYTSLTKVAYAITCTNWNGPRFFGLRDKHS